MAATARMILQVDPAEKARWTSEARKAGISTSEFVRRRAALVEPDPELVLTPAEAALLKAAASEIHGAADRMAANLDEISASIRQMNFEMSDPGFLAAQRARIMAELKASGVWLDLDRLRERAA